jgi:hypothetical protein
LGPDAAPYAYDADGRLATNPTKPFDLPRATTLFDPADPQSHRAIIGDPRNDENSIVCQLHLAFILFHNKIIDHFKAAGVSGKDLFKAARREVRFTYQKIVVTDFLKRIIRKDVYDGFVYEYATNGDAAYKLYKPGALRDALPIEFTGAAYRFGHSAVRNAYRLNNRGQGGFQRKIFEPIGDVAESLVGFGDLPDNHEIDWTLFVTDALAPGDKSSNKSTRPDGTPLVSPTDDDPKRLQYAYKIDTTLVDPLKLLPPRISGSSATKPPASTFRSLAARNLKRGYNFSLPSGQDIAKRLGVTNHPPLVFGEELKKFEKMESLDDNGKPDFKIPADAAAALEAKTPLWLYILAEAQAMLARPDGSFKTKVENNKTVIDKDSNQGTQLGPVGGRILLEVFFGILDDDPGSYFNTDPNKPWVSIVKPGAATITLWDLLHCIGKV